MLTSFGPHGVVIIPQRPFFTDGTLREQVSRVNIRLSEWLDFLRAPELHYTQYIVLGALLGLLIKSALREGNCCLSLAPLCL